MTTPANHLFCFGLGYSAGVLAKRLAGRGWSIAGTSRTPESCRDLAARGFSAVLPFAREHPLENPVENLREVTHVLVSVPPDEAGDPVLDRHGRDVANLPGLQWLGYLSTTGVYGNRDGGWVDEESELLPSSPRSERRAAAERAWLRLRAEAGVPVHIFRLAGIYGPGRSPLDTVRAGKAKRIDRPGQVFSRIHVEDIARVLEASMAAPYPGRTYNVCDDLAAAPAEVTAHACALLGVEPPPLVALDDAGLSPMGRSFWLDNKRVSNRRLHEELGVELRYPDYRSGLASLL